MTKRTLTAIFICTTIILQAQQPAAETRVNETFRKTRLTKVLKVIQNKYAVKFAYDNALVDNIIVSIQLNDLTVSQSLDRLLEGTPLTFELLAESYLLIPRPRETNVAIDRKNISISGAVVDADNGETLPQATIRVKNTSIATTSNNDGYFSLLNIPDDTCSLELMYIGYITQGIPIRNIDKPEHVIIKLKSDTRLLNEVVVLGEYNHAVHVEDFPGAFVFNPASVSSLPSLGEQDMSRTLQLLPGVTATDETSSGMVIRGSHPTYNLTLLDGMTIYQQDHFFGAFSIINSDVIKDVHVYKGMFDPKFGGRTSGVVDITTKNGNATRPSFNVKMNLMNLKASAEIPLGKKWSLFAAGRRSYTDAVQTKLFTTLFDIASLSNDQIDIFAFEGLTSNAISKYYFYDANSKLTFRPTERDVISLSAYTGRDKMLITDSLAIIDESGKFIYEHDEKTHWGNNGLSLRWGRQWTQQYYSNIRISSSKFFRLVQVESQTETDSGSGVFSIDIGNTISDLSYAIDNEWSVTDNLSLTFGLSGTQQTYAADLDYKLTAVAGDPLEEQSDEFVEKDDQSSWLNSMYASVNISPIKRLKTIVGLRLAHYNNQNDQFYIEPRISTIYKVKDNVTLKVGYGRNNQFITQQYFNSRIGTISGLNENYWTLSVPGDLRYPVISSDHITGGATFRSKRFVYDAELFYKQTRGVIIDENFNSGTTHAYGIDMMVQKTSGIHTGWIAYSIGRATQIHPYVFNGQAAPSFQDQRHELKVVDMLTLGNWNLSATAIYGSGKPFQAYSIRYSHDENGLITAYDPTIDHSNDSRLPDYFRIDLAASYKLHFDQKRTLELGLSIHNVTDHKNIKARRLDTARLDETIFTETELAPTYNDIVLMGISPSLFLNFSF